MLIIPESKNEIMNNLVDHISCMFGTWSYRYFLGSLGQSGVNSEAGRSGRYSFLKM